MVVIFFKGYRIKLCRIFAVKLIATPGVYFTQICGPRQSGDDCLSTACDSVILLTVDAPVTGISAGVADLLIPMAAGDSKSATTKVQPSYTSVSINDPG